MIKKITVLSLLLTALTFSQTGWQFVSSVPTSPAINSISVVDANVIFVCTDGGSVYRSLNGGAAWERRSTGLPAVNCYGICALDSLNCWVGSGSTNGAIYKTTNGGASWTLQVNVAGSFINGIKMFSPNYGVYVADPTGSGVPYQFRYTVDGGTNWYLTATAPIATSEFGVINAWDWIDTNRFVVGSANTLANATSAKIFRTTTGFNGTWSSTAVTGTGGSTGLYYQAIALTDANNGMAGSNANKIVKTTDGGVTWTQVTNPSGLTTFAAINAHGLKDGSNIIRFSINETTGYKMFKTTNLGTTWTEEVLPTQGATNGVQHMQFVDANLGYAGGNAGTFMKYVGIVPVELTSFTAVGTPGLVNLNWKTATETNNRGFEIQRNIDGAGWSVLAFRTGAGTAVALHEYSYVDDISSINADKISYRLKQVDYNGNYDYSPEVLVNSIVPTAYILDQNFPNPFNPATTISYRIPESGFVSLKVYNNLGQEMTQLVNEVKSAGSYKIEFDASNLTSGVYYYLLKVNDFVQTKKMTLIK